MEFSGRQRNILRAVISSYIDSALPVASQTVTKSFSIGLSPATIRHIMAELEEMGFLSQPHPSAGRVPTSKGYRLYVDDLLEEWLSGAPSDLFREAFLEERYLAPKSDDIHGLLQETTRMLSMLSHYAGLVLAPNSLKARLERIEFILLRPGVCLALLVSKDGLVQHRTIEADPDWAQTDLTRISQLLNAKFAGKSLEEIRSQLLREMKAEKDLYDRMLQEAMEFGRRLLTDQPQDELYVGGASNILDLPDFADVEKMRDLFKTFEEKASILKLLNCCMETEGVQILIGSEIDHPAIRGCSLVVSTYRGASNSIGTLGVIGPTRMEYDRVIPLVDQTAKLLGRLLEKFDSTKGGK